MNLLNATPVLRLASQSYRRFVSPFTGLACAHRVLHDGRSCSHEFERLLNEQSATDALESMASRLRECASAARSLKKSGQRRNDEGRIIIPCVPFI